MIKCARTGRVNIVKALLAAAAQRQVGENNASDEDLDWMKQRETSLLDKSMNGKCA
jgi:hypothetical protein